MGTLRCSSALGGPHVKDRKWKGLCEILARGGQGGGGEDDGQSFLARSKKAIEQSIKSVVGFGVVIKNNRKRRGGGAKRTGSGSLTKSDLAEGGGKRFKGQRRTRLDIFHGKVKLIVQGASNVRGRNLAGKRNEY